MNLKLRTMSTRRNEVAVGLLKNPVPEGRRAEADRRPSASNVDVSLTGVASGPAVREDGDEAFFNSPAVRS